MQAAATRAGLDLRIESAGIYAPVGQPPSPLAVEVTAQRGIDISGHRAIQLLPRALRDNELCLVMERYQRDLLTRLAPRVETKVFTLGHWDKVDIEDPMGQPVASFERTLSLIEQAVERWLPYLSA